jgi:serine/threonine-protein kinase HipA
MSSDRTGPLGEAFVWIWLPDAVAPVVAGRVVNEGAFYSFNYGQSYLARRDAMAIYLPALPLRRGANVPEPPLIMAACLRDVAPDAWGRRVIINRLRGLKGDAARDVDFDELTFLLNSGSDRGGGRAGFPVLGRNLHAAGAGQRHARGGARGGGPRRAG